MAGIGDVVDIEGAYAASLRHWRRQRHAVAETAVLIKLAKVLEDVGRWDGAARLEEEVKG